MSLLWIGICGYYRATPPWSLKILIFVGESFSVFGCFSLSTVCVVVLIKTLFANSRRGVATKSAHVSFNLVARPKRI